MTNPNRVMTALVTALGEIQREAERPDARRHYILGVVEQAIKNWKAECEMNRHGYLVLKGSDQ